MPVLLCLQNKRSSIAQLSFDTPGSSVVRAVSFDMMINYPGKEAEISFASPWKKTSIKGMGQRSETRICVWTRSRKHVLCCCAVWSSAVAVCEANIYELDHMNIYIWTRSRTFCCCAVGHPLLLCVKLYIYVYTYIHTYQLDHANIFCCCAVWSSAVAVCSMEHNITF